MRLLNVLKQSQEQLFYVEKVEPTAVVPELRSGLLAAKSVTLDYKQKHCAHAVFLKQWTQIFH